MPALQSSLSEFQVNRPDVSVDAVFRALDGQDIDFDGDACQVEVCGIYDDRGQRWVQLALAGTRPRMVTIRLGAEPLNVVSRLS